MYLQLDISVICLTKQLKNELHRKINQISIDNLLVKYRDRGAFIHACMHSFLHANKLSYLYYLREIAGSSKIFYYFSEKLDGYCLLVFFSAERTLQIVAFFCRFDLHVHITLLAERNVLARLYHHAPYLVHANAARQSLSQLLSRLFFKMAKVGER